MASPDDRTPSRLPDDPLAPTGDGPGRDATLDDPERIAMLLTTIEGIADGVVVSHLSGRFLLFNPAAQRILRAGPIESTPGDWPSRYGLFLPDGETPFPTDRLPLVRAMNGETVDDTEIFVRRPDVPDGIWISVKATPFRNALGELSGGIAVFRDVTERKRMEREVVQAKERAEEASRAKGIFLATMSHEIRTPLNSILGMTHLLERSPLSPRQLEFLKVIQESGRSLLSLIEDTLSFSQIEAGRVVLERRPFAPRRIVERAVRILAQSAHDKGLELAFWIDPAVPERVVGDPGRLRQVLLNLVGNAVKFTEKGEVVLTMGVAGSQDGRVTLRCSVADTGIGIPREKQGMIFESFAQADGSTSRRFGGTGLGLAIVSRFVEMMGGTIGVESDAGRGSTFTFTAVYESVEAPRPPALSGWREARVLVADTHRTSREFLGRLLGELGLKPEIVGTEDEVLERVRAGGDPFRLLFVDAGCPKKGGIALIERLREIPEPRPDPVLLFPSGAPPEGLHMAESLGVRHFLSKPVRVEDLRKVLERIEAGTGQAHQEEESSGAPSPPSRSLRILVVEDSAANRNLAGRLLEGWGHRVLTAGTGMEAIEIVIREPLDVVLMDLEMPGVDGIEATRRLRRREEPGGPHVPIYAMTAHALPAERERCLAAGMDGFITKPIDIENLRLTLERLGSLPF